MVLGIDPSMVEISVSYLISSQYALVVSGGFNAKEMGFFEKKIAEKLENGVQGVPEDFFYQHPPPPMSLVFSIGVQCF